MCAWGTQILYEYTNKIDWTDQELESLLNPSCSDLQKRIQKQHSITAYQVIASGLQGIWTYFLKAFLEDVFLASNIIFNIMSNSARRYIMSNAYLTLKK